MLCVSNPCWFFRLLLFSVLIVGGEARSADTAISIGNDNYVVSGEEKANFMQGRSRRSHVEQSFMGISDDPRSSGYRERKKRSLSGEIETVVVEGAVIVRIHLNPAYRRGTYTVYAGRGTIGHIEVIQEPSRKVYVKNSREFISETTPEVTFYLPELVAVETDGVADVVLDGVMERKMELNLGGAGDMVVSGTVDHLLLSKDGTGDLDASRLIAKHIEITQRGAGDSILNPQRSIKGENSGVGDVVLFGRKKAILFEDVQGGVEYLERPVIH